uniref:non-specific serine/threonine protein kinase n=1 Tax=Oryza glumipatula TaxID=40148 RepID=A0A0D9ZQP8_9ORYZ
MGKRGGRGKIATHIRLQESMEGAVAQAQKAPTATTDPNEAAALNDVFAKLGQKAAASWNTTGDPCSGTATDGTDINDSSINPAIKCDCSDQNNTVCHITRLSFDINTLSGPVPKELGNLTNLISLGFGSNNFNGSLPSELGSLFNLEQLYIDSAGLSGALPSSFSKLTRMKILWASDNNFTGQIPDYIGGWNLTDLDFSYNQLSGNFPSWASDKKLQLYLVANNFVIDRSNSSRSMTDSNNNFYQTDDATLGPASYNVRKTSSPIWAVSNVGKFMDTLASDGNYMIFYSSQSQNTLASELFQSARMSPSSLRYYGIGLENGNYNVTLQFAELGFTESQSWRGTGRRVFDIYVQGERKEQNFDIRKAVGGKSNTAIKKDYTIHVTKNIVEIHLFWAGKGTCCIPSQGYYGPSISALSVTPSTLLNYYVFFV